MSRRSNDMLDTLLGKWIDGVEAFAKITVIALTVIVAIRILGGFAGWWQ